MKGSIKELAILYARRMETIYKSKGISATFDKVYDSPRHLIYPVKLASPIDVKKVLDMEESLKLVTASRKVNLYVNAGSVIHEIEIPENMWKTLEYSKLLGLEGRTGLEVGFQKTGSPATFSFDEPHTLVSGKTGSGKSSAMDTILYSIMNTYSEDELEVYIIDPHYNFAYYPRTRTPKFRDCVHIKKIVSSANDISVLFEAMEAELVRRFAMMESGDFNWGKRIVIIIDECQSPIVFGEKDDNSINKPNVAIASRIATEARKIDMNMIIGTQKPSVSNLPRIINQLGNRYIGLVNNAAESALLTGRTDAGAHYSTGKGDFLHIAGPIEERLQFAVVSPLDIKRLPKKTKALTGITKNQTSCIDPIKFAEYLNGIADNLDNEEVQRYNEFKSKFMSRVGEIRSKK